MAIPVRPNSSAVTLAFLKFGPNIDGERALDIVAKSGLEYVAQEHDFTILPLLDIGRVSLIGITEITQYFSDRSDTNRNHKD